MGLTPGGQTKPHPEALRHSRSCDCGGRSTRVVLQFVDERQHRLVAAV